MVGRSQGVLTFKEAACCSDLPSGELLGIQVDLTTAPQTNLGVPARGP